jgi:hypothetical protein
MDIHDGDQLVPAVFVEFNPQKDTLVQKLLNGQLCCSRKWLMALTSLPGWPK